MKQLYLIGTYHLDMKGPERLEKFLGFVRPNVIGLETTEENFNRRIEDHNLLELQHSLLLSQFKLQYGQKTAKNIIKYLEMLGFENWVSGKFSKENLGVSLVYCDEVNKEVVRMATKKVFGDSVSETQDVTVDYVKKLAMTDFNELQKEVDLRYKNNSVAELKKDSDLFKRLNHDRDEIAELKIREAYSNVNQNMVYVGGQLHFFGEYRNLYDRLKDLSPVRVPLSDVDSF
jgi:hypothetical protein